MIATVFMFRSSWHSQGTNKAKTGYNTESTEWPSIEDLDIVKSLIDKFFNLLDNDSSAVGDILADEIFSSDARSGFGGHFFVGSEQIRESRDSAWAAVKARRHLINKVYVSDSKADDLLFIGHVTMNLRNGKEVAGEFTGRVKIANPGQSPRLSLYQLWAVQSPRIFRNHPANI
ncbi:uncharacterized protein A1O5_04333 [Cladophialophora psammophila CBS 110553]|uniref:SnoaL-like domain-containing protein n=1 Tax=Cladophialophora psammophila CBS 110553 TaxID=1182543 RepID=W9WUJ5_9EURO|nr:uncharacterized protein A1O5_04333 [Cladophialophora psammophila CBS 110553]EXJ71832.1 hypothetical protein A1O5_04333 [Cladophialophora psammophila CBS 110553]